MRTVYSKTELERALTSGEKHIIAKGEIAKELRKKENLKEAVTVGGALLALGGIIAAPFTAGTSLIPSAGIIAAGATATITITAAELAILCGTTIAITAILKGRKLKLKFKDDGSVELEVE